mgnify:CR=1 FL=1
MQGILFTDCKTPAEIEECIYMTMPDTPEYGGRFGYPSYRWIGYHPISLRWITPKWWQIVSACS